MLLFLIVRSDQEKQKYNLCVLGALAVQHFLSLIGRGMQLKKQGLLNE
jgi:hypothetical protein